MDFCSIITLQAERVNTSEDVRLCAYLSSVDFNHEIAFMELRDFSTTAAHYSCDWIRWHLRCDYTPDTFSLCFQQFGYKRASVFFFFYSQASLVLTLFHNRVLCILTNSPSQTLKAPLRVLSVIVKHPSECLLTAMQYKHHALDCSCTPFFFFRLQESHHRFPSFFFSRLGRVFHAVHFVSHSVLQTAVICLLYFFVCMTNNLSLSTSKVNKEN